MMFRRQLVAWGPEDDEFVEDTQNWAVGHYYYILSSSYIGSFHTIKSLLNNYYIIIITNNYYYIITMLFAASYDIYQLGLMGPS